MTQIAASDAGKTSIAGFIYQAVGAAWLGTAVLQKPGVDGAGDDWDAHLAIRGADTTVAAEAHQAADAELRAPTGQVYWYQFKMRSTKKIDLQELRSIMKALHATLEGGAAPPDMIWVVTNTTLAAGPAAQCSDAARALRRASSNWEAQTDVARPKGQQSWTFGQYARALLDQLNEDTGRIDLDSLRKIIERIHFKTDFSHEQAVSGLRAAASRFGVLDDEFHERAWLMIEPLLGGVAQTSWGEVAAKDLAFRLSGQATSPAREVSPGALAEAAWAGWFCGARSKDPTLCRLVATGPSRKVAAAIAAADLQGCVIVGGDGAVGKTAAMLCAGRDLYQRRRALPQTILPLFLDVGSGARSAADALHVAINRPRPDGIPEPDACRLAIRRMAQAGEDQPFAVVVFADGADESGREYAVRPLLAAAEADPRLRLVLTRRRSALHDPEHYRAWTPAAGGAADLVGLSQDLVVDIPSEPSHDDAVAIADGLGLPELAELIGRAHSASPEQVGSALGQSRAWAAGRSPLALPPRVNVIARMAELRRNSAQDYDALIQHLTEGDADDYGPLRPLACLVHEEIIHKCVRNGVRGDDAREALQRYADRSSFQCDRRDVEAMRQAVDCGVLSRVTGASDTYAWAMLFIRDYLRAQGGTDQP